MNNEQQAFTLQLETTEPNNWTTVKAYNATDAIIELASPLIKAGANPTVAFVALGDKRHANGAPICVQGYKLKVNRDRELRIGVPLKTHEAV